MAPIAYVNGRAYHDGWYDALQLDQSMFPLDVQGTTSQALVAWAAAISTMFTGVAHGLASHWLVALFGFATDFLLIAAFIWLLERSDNRGRKQADVPVNQEKSLSRRVLDRASQPFLMLGLLAAVGFALTACLMIVISGLVLPFSKVGGDQAKHEVAINFADRPMMHVKFPDGERMMREIACGPQFCAFWDIDKTDRAIVAPVSAVIWGEAPPPDSK
jgi:hypothetical protein